MEKVLLLKPRVFSDSRGYLYEGYRQTQPGLLRLVQTNLCRSQRNVLRGLHLQRVQPQAKLITVVRGLIFDVAVDLRPGSPSFGHWDGFYLSDENHHQLYLPEGYAHGYCVLSEQADVLYQCSDYYHPDSEVCISWNDPKLNIDWPVREPILSEKDAVGISLEEFA